MKINNKHTVTIKIMCYKEKQENINRKTFLKN